ncbi:MAG: 50S ribosomal protein L11 methyltransferase [Phycisphaerae bacterium]
MKPSTPSSPSVLLGYAVREETWTIAGRPMTLTWVEDTAALLDLHRVNQWFKQDEYMPYWAQPWPAAVLLAEKVLTGPAGEGRPAIELGCGIGLVSIAAALAGWSVLATDYDPDAVGFALHNAERNRVRLAGDLLDYRVPLDRPAYELVLASDLLYVRSYAEPLARWIASALLPGGQAWLSDPNRSAADDFPKAAQGFGLGVEVEPVETTTPAGLVTRGRIWRVEKSYAHPASAGSPRPE